MRLENTKVKKWKDLVDAFMRQYKFNIDVDPDRLNLQAMEKDNKESIRKYARRWREVAAQVNSPMLEKEMINLFSTTLKLHTLNTWLEALHKISLTWLL